MDLRRVSLWVLAVLVVLGLAVVGVDALWWRSVDGEGPLTAPTVVVIAPGQGTAQIAERLAVAQVIGSARLFKAAVRVEGLEGNLKAGEYAFDPHVSLKGVLDKLEHGDVVQHSVTIPEGWTAKQAMDALRAQPDLKGETKGVAEGRLFPDTYSFVAGEAREHVLHAMTRRMDKELADAWALRKPDLPLNTPDDLLVLASIVQKEAANDAEMPQIAAVFVNRLKAGMKLQSDPTVMYGADLGGTNDIKKKDLTEPQPFNTYVYVGLPPTPISNPGRAALRAVAVPDAVPYLFFVAKPDRSGHVFATTYAEHQKNVKAYWAGQKKDEGAKK